MAQGKFSTVKIRQGEKVHEAFPANQVGPAIRQGKLNASDEFFVDGKGWFRLDKHPKLAPLFQRQTPAPAKASAPPPQEVEDDDKIKCPACGHRQIETPTCEACGILFKKYFEAKKKRGGRRAPPVKQEPESISMNPFKLIGPLWRGEFALWVHFWLFGGLGNFLLEFYIMGFIQEVAKQTEEPGMVLVALMLAGSLFMFVYWLITLIGIWRSAGNYQGIPMMGVLARIVVFLSLFPFVFGIFFVGTLLLRGL